MNTGGSYHCACAEGYYLQSDNRTCVAGMIQHILACMYKHTAFVHLLQVVRDIFSCFLLDTISFQMVRVIHVLKQIVNTNVN